MECDEGYGPGGRREGCCSGIGGGTGRGQSGPHQKVRAEWQSSSRPSKKRGECDSCPPVSLSFHLPPPPSPPVFPILGELSEVTT